MPGTELKTLFLWIISSNHPVTLCGRYVLQIELCPYPQDVFNL